MFSRKTEQYENESRSEYITSRCSGYPFDQYTTTTTNTTSTARSFGVNYPLPPTLKQQQQQQPLSTDRISTRQLLALAEDTPNPKIIMK